MPLFSWTVRFRPVDNDPDYYVVLATGSAEDQLVAARDCMATVRRFRAAGYRNLNSRVLPA